MKTLAEEFPKLGDKINWYPGHMHRAMRLIKENISNIDIFLEIRDARAPISSRNQEFDQLIQEYNKKKIIIFNKHDLCNQRVMQQLIDNYNQAGIDCLTLSAKRGTNMSVVVKQIQQKIPTKFQSVGLWMMLCGMPNVGKSTIINQLRQIQPNLHSKKALAKSTPLPCTTKSVLGIKVSEKPLAYIVDSPGVMVPSIIDQETALKLSIIGCIKDVIPGKEPLMDFLVWSLNKQKVQKYVHYYGLKEPVKKGADLFMHVRDKYKHFNYEATFDMILAHFRNGHLGKITLDNIDF